MADTARHDKTAKLLRPGHRLGEADVQKLRLPLARRDQHNQRL